MSTANIEKRALMSTLPGDDVRQIMWRFTDRYDLQMVIQSARSVARGVIARMVADKQRHTHDWTPEKQAMLKAFDEAGITAAFMEPEQGGYITGPKNLVLAMIAFELCWVDAGAATASLANNLALEPIHEKGTPEQIQKYMGGCVPPKPGESRKMLRGSFALTEPLPYVGVDAGMLSGKIRIAEWKEGKEPILQVEKRGRFITNMGYANFVTASVDTDDPRIKSSCMVILEEGDPGLYDRGAPTLKLVHQLSSTHDPIFSLKVPASRIIGGYTVKDGVIIPNFNNSEVIEAVFRRTRVTVGIMTTAKLLSAIEPVIRYQRTRFRGGDSATPGNPRYDLGIQQKEDPCHRLVDVWATGEAGASLGFEAARLFDVFDPMEQQKNELFEKQGIKGPRAQMKAFMEPRKKALEYIDLMAKPASQRDKKRVAELESDLLVQYLIKESLADVFCPACKLWNTGQGATMMREAVSLMGGYGITEDCPGFLTQKWSDAQLEATYEGPECVQRRQMSLTMVNEIFLAQFKNWISDLRELAKRKPEMGSEALAGAMELWLWSLEYLENHKDANGKTLYGGQRQGVMFPMTDALAWLLGARQLILDTLELEEKGPQNPVLAEGLLGVVNFYSDLCGVQAARAAGEVGRICTELVYGYQAKGCACAASDADLKAFAGLRAKNDVAFAGLRFSKDRAAEAVAHVMIPEALDYPL
ncbi:MAG TPA: acyl-CoA dehydrogenase family protein [Candidatus Omnitrophota bacterium]|nr:acyl-CoA dehydrogenase family protein [Candidatus Omnitrophota bacterium]